MGLLGGPLKITQQSESQVSEDLISTTTSATLLCSSRPVEEEIYATEDEGAVGESCQTLLCPRWVLLLFVTEFQGRAGPGVTEEVLTTVVGVAVKVDINVKEELGWIMELEKSLVCGK